MPIPSDFMFKKTLFLVVGALALPASTVAAEDAATSPVGAVQTLPAVTIQGSEPGSDLVPAPYAGGQVAQGARLGILGNRGVMDTPFNVTAYTEEMVRNAQATSLAHVFVNDPSVRSIWSLGSYTDLFYVRGFQLFTSDAAYNGLFGALPYQYVVPEMAERIEILKGPSAMLSGIAPNGSIAGLINVVPKRATDDPITRLTLGYMSRGQLQTAVDVGRRYGEDNEFGIRFNGVYRDGSMPVHGQSQKLATGVVGLDWRGDGVRLSADFGQQYQNFDSPTGPYYILSGIDVPAAPKGSKNLAAPWAFVTAHDTFGTVRGEVDINPNLTAYAAVGALRHTNDNLTAQPNITSGSGAMSVSPYYWAGSFDSKTAETGLRAKAETGPVNHEFVLTATTFNQVGRSSILLTPAIVSNIHDPVWGPKPSSAGFDDTPQKNNETTMNSVAFADTMSLDQDRLQITAGLRQQYIKSDAYNQVTGDRDGKRSYNRHRLTPSLAVVVKPAENVSLYANYIQGLMKGSTAPANALNYGDTFAPFVATQYELGAKVDFGQFSTTVSAFQIEQASGVTDPATMIYSVDGQQRNSGIEINTFGELSRGVRVLGGLTFMQGKLTKTASASTDGNKAPGVPNLLVNLGGEWDLPFVQGLTLTGNVVYTSSQYVDTGNTQKIPSWTRFDVGARYALKVAGRPVTLRATVQNVMNKDYWAASSATYGLARGAPRIFLLSASVDF